jgi:hypothetical protein
MALESIRVLVGRFREDQLKYSATSAKSMALETIANIEMILGTVSV